ncbi:MAG: UDP-2,4-diacetamido-2,4,6-trideoxy-beta-L-altropyranose hydrolase [Planctomycetes bacterium]|nr:UDP-2,4-diacetamido-2,4,6-trideoxy-beta-L-altropyranose hydrolase [Planctomycetota bacterium]
MIDALLIRADASPQIGTGHVMRCIALAQAWNERGGDVMFLLAKTTPSISELLRHEGFGVRTTDAEPGSPADAAATVACARELSTRFVVADSYRFADEYQQALKAADLRVLLLDDYGHARHYSADLVLNQNFMPDSRLYSHREPGTNLLLGNKYTLLRREFRVLKNQERKFLESDRKVLVTLGGSDPDNATAKVIEALGLLANIDAMVVVGGSSPHRQELELLVARQQISGQSIRLVANVRNMPELMSWADLAVVAGGSTVWELACLGVPAIILVIAENQRQNAKLLSESGSFLNLGEHRLVDAPQIANAIGSLLASSEKRQAMSALGRIMVDGKGAARVCERFLAGPISLRRAKAEDCRRFWEWANDPVVRAVSFHSEPIPWEIHDRWFANKLQDPKAQLWIGLNAWNQPFGQVRFEIREGDRAEICTSVDAAHRKAGFGTALIRQAVAALFATTKVSVVEARIKMDNVASIRAFEKAGFCAAQSMTVTGTEAIVFLRSRDP